MAEQPVILLDCTLRDGGYYNDWDFDADLVQAYLESMVGIAVDYVELGFRSFDNSSFRGAYAYTTDAMLRSLSLPEGLNVGVMVNASEVLRHKAGLIPAMQLLFSPAAQSPVKLVRLACHVHEFEATLPACDWLKEQGYKVGINLMQIADRQPDEIECLARTAEGHALDVLYFADSMAVFLRRRLAM